MSVTYTNRKGRTYYLCQGVTKRGKPRYYFSREPKGTVIEEIPEGYEVRESVNGVVSLARVRPLQLLDEEVETVRAVIQTHPKAKRYRVDVKPKQVIIYEHVGPDLSELVTTFAEELGIRELVGADEVQRLQEEENVYGQFTPIMRFILTDAEKRYFKAQRMCLLGGMDDWIDVAYNQSITELAPKLIPTLGTDEFFELF
jgi:hypothetical protein